MDSQWIRKAFTIFVLAGVILAAGCGGPSLEGRYQDSSGAVTLDLKGGKATLNFGALHLDATYKAENDKLTLSPVSGDQSQTIVFTLNKDGSLDAPEGSMMPRLQKAK